MTAANDSGRRGVFSALVAAVLFGAGMPFAKLLLDDVSPWMMAGLLYLGSGLGLCAYRRLIAAPPVQLPRAEARALAGAVFAGGVCGPVLLMFGLSRIGASEGSLLLNTEGAFTALLAWFVFRENFDKRIAVGMALVLAGAVVMSWPSDARWDALWPVLAVLTACFAWGVDNNLTRKVSLTDATWIATVKGLAAGAVNLCLAVLTGSNFPSLLNGLGAMGVGVFAYGVSLALFVVALRDLGTARTGAYFSVAPFFGAVLAVLLGDPVTINLLLAGSLMGAGVWLHLTERHSHQHLHEALEHDHDHVHDEHHQHSHGALDPAGARHTHPHKHAPLRHRHVHYPDAHHRHEH